nr:hypothetical protein [Tanacetum cinerariifolium]
MVRVIEISNLTQEVYVTLTFVFDLTKDVYVTLTEDVYVYVTLTLTNDESFPILNTLRNSSGGSPEVVKDGMDSGFVDTKVVEGVDEPVRTTLNSFTSKRVTFMIVENYVKNAWKKFSLVPEMMNSNGFFFFKFASIEGRSEFGSHWVKFHDIPIVAFTVDGLSVMATKLGNLSMVDSYAMFVCLQSWDRMDYARALIDIRADQELKEDMVIAILNVEDDGEVLHMVRVKYEWETPRCGTNVGSKVQFMPKKPIWKVVSKENSASSSEQHHASPGRSPNEAAMVGRVFSGLMIG